MRKTVFASMLVLLAFGVGHAQGQAPATPPAPGQAGRGAGPTAAERAAARQAALTPGAQVISGTLREGKVGQTPYEAIKPAMWNGTLVLDLDFVSDTWGGPQRRWFLEHGYAIGGPNRQQDASAYEMRDHVDNFLTIRKLFIDKFGTPKRTISFGVSRAGFPALSAIDMHPEIFTATLAMSGGGHGVVGTLLSKLDAVWAIKMLVDPASPLTLVHLPAPGAGRYAPDEDLNAIVAKARATPEGQARLALAASFDQAPTWSIRNSPQPGPTDYDAQLENVVTNFAGQFPARIRYLNEAMAGGNFSWNHGVDYKVQLERSGMIDLVKHAYAKAGANLDADLATLAKAPRVAADPAAVAKAEGNGGYKGKTKGPVLLIKTIGDSYDPAAAEMAYEDMMRKAGTVDLVRTVYVNRPGHASQTVLEKITAFQTLINRLDTGKWDSAKELPDRMNALAAEIKKATTTDLGVAAFAYHRPATAVRQWDFTNWGTYAPPKAGATPTGGSASLPWYASDPSWPKPLPNNWVIGAVASVAVDSHDHVWILQRPKTIAPKDLEGKTAAPPVIEFDQAGNVVQGWGGPGNGYPWMEPNDTVPFPRGGAAEHGIYVDNQDNVWVCGNGDLALKFTRNGKLLLQIGELGKSGGDSSKTLLGHPTDIAVDPRTNDIFISDGYFNRRIVVFDAKGVYKRHWGAYGKPPDDAPRAIFDPKGPPPQNFFAAHCVKLSNDGFVYVCDRQRNRLQVFKTDGTFVRELFIAPETPAGVGLGGMGGGSVYRVGFSPDREQRYFYVGDSGNSKVWILQRSTLQILGSFEAHGIHHLSGTDSKGNIYITGRKGPERFMPSGKETH